VFRWLPEEGKACSDAGFLDKGKISEICK